ncbi:MAG: Hsp20/alpha crystallin family protein [Thermoprotei archaeon]|nr:MAG: Hsp20/alpha crystallin family protein [Thermoprotei archaeon]
MSEFDEWYKRTKKFFDEIDKLFERIMSESFFFETEEKPLDKRVRKRVYGPYYYGFSVTLGPDGIPRVKEWGNIKPGYLRPVVREAIEPFTDVIEEEDKIRIIMDLPGVEKEDINIEATEEEVRVSAERGDRKYYKTVRLPDSVKPDTAKATYKNGVLTIILEKVRKGKDDKGIKIKIE